MSLFRDGEFTAHSGARLSWKIECDALDTADWQWAAARVAERVTFHTVYGVPRGGLLFAEALEQYRRPTGRYYLIVDDVLTTGNSLRKASSQVSPLDDILGVVLFARIPPPKRWMRALFLLSEWDD